MSDIQTALKDKIEFADSPVNGDSDKKASLFMLWYRENTNPHPLTKYFFHKGDLRSAIARGKTHCEKMGQRFIFVRPFLMDLDQEEKRHQGVFE